MAKARGEIYQPGEEQRRLFPEVSGNAINGLGEETPRRPRHIYWHDPGTLPHGRLQMYVSARFGQLPELEDLEHKSGGRGPKDRAPIAERRADASPEAWSARVKEFALSHEADLVGIARVERDWVFEGCAVSEPWIVVLGVAMDHAHLSAAPEVEAVVEVLTQYNRAARAARALTDWIRGQGWDATSHEGPASGSITLIPPALSSGFGELGKHGSIINRRLGSSFRLAGVATGLPLVADAPDVFGADDFCLHCRVCADACPPAAIFEEKRMVRGTRKWFVDFDRCIPYFNDTYGCAICIAVCPWSLPGVAPRLAEKLSRRRARIGEAREGA